jgi:hypothetical protein
MVRELAVAGSLSGAQMFRFSFPRVDMPYESYEGVLGSCRYFVRVTISKGGYGGGSVVKEQDFIVQNVEKVRACWRGGGARTRLCRPTRLPVFCLQSIAPVDASVKLEVRMIARKSNDSFPVSLSSTTSALCGMLTTGRHRGLPAH